MPLGSKRRLCCLSQRFGGLTIQSSVAESFNGFVFWCNSLWYSECVCLFISWRSYGFHPLSADTTETAFCAASIELTYYGHANQLKVKQSRAKRLSRKAIIEVCHKSNMDSSPEETTEHAFQNLLKFIYIIPIFSRH